MHIVWSAVFIATGIEVSDCTLCKETKELLLINLLNTATSTFNTIFRMSIVVRLCTGQKSCMMYISLQMSEI